MKNNSSIRYALVTNYASAYGKEIANCIINDGGVIVFGKKIRRLKTFNR
ncbi:hypothetical protein [Rickettsiales endosymbiont of Trichoplax sp. H2]|nr:hypothetical protein [Rickettsiales endosymbiont of Trichoplax sp. H2]MSO14004.1 hypothetical protein [Rickettsiales endosymbiont of Trichoplax sp. H2]